MKTIKMLALGSAFVFGAACYAADSVPVPPIPPADSGVTITPATPDAPIVTDTGSKAGCEKKGGNGNQERKQKQECKGKGKGGSGGGGGKGGGRGR